MKSTPSVRHNIFANFAGKVWSGIFSLAFVPVYIQLMGVEVYGLIGISMARFNLFRWINGAPATGCA